jgi:hypothetical protein
VHNHYIKAVGPLDNGKIFIIFDNNESKVYDIRNMIKYIPQFKDLINSELFYKVRPEAGGIAVKWNADMDIASDELYENSKSYRLNQRINA